MSRYPVELRSILQSVLRKKIFDLILKQQNWFNFQGLVDALKSDGTPIEKDDLKKFLLVLQTRKYVNAIKADHGRMLFRLNRKLAAKLASQP